SSARESGRAWSELPPRVSERVESCNWRSRLDRYDLLSGSTRLAAGSAGARSRRERPRPAAACAVRQLDWTCQNRSCPAQRSGQRLAMGTGLLLLVADSKRAIQRATAHWKEIEQRP